MRKIVCGGFGNIYDAEILKSGKMSSRNIREVTEECIDAVVEHLQCLSVIKNKDIVSYRYPKIKGDGNYNLVVYDDTKYKIVPICEKINEE